MPSFPRAWLLLTAGLALLFASLGQGQHFGQFGPPPDDGRLPPGAVARLGPAEGKARRGAGKREAIFAAEFTPDGKSLVTVGQDGTTRTWDAATGKEVGRGAGPERNRSSDPKRNRPPRPGDAWSGASDRGAWPPTTCEFVITLERPLGQIFSQKKCRGSERLST